MTTDKLTAVIMAGGAGTRFWPVSTEARPKQFLALLGQRTLLQESYDRLVGLLPPERILVLTAKRFVDICAEQLPELPRENIIGEPMRRDTAAAVALAAALVEHRHGKDALMAVLTSDHRITPKETFQQDLTSAVNGAAGAQGALYTFGIKPSYPSTGFGYLQRGASLADASDGTTEHYKLERFREKPDRATAEQFVESGEFYWNSGMFVWSISAITAELEKHLPDHIAKLREAVKADGTDGFDGALAAGFEPLQKISIDFGVMEKAADVRCCVARFEWSDVGGWVALEEFLGKDGAENAHRGGLSTRDANNNIVFCEDDSEHVALIGVHDLVVVRTGDKTLVVTRERAEEIKKLVQELDERLR